ncbi:MAG: ABC transporter substrate-binding protein [Methylibium sp.]|nr:ABC transporter substrate-binding protein [Methylibium sp.]
MRSDRRRWLIAAGAGVGASALALGIGAETRAQGRTGAPTTIRDDLAREVSLSLPLRRVVVFNRYTTEFIRGIGAMPAVVGVDIDAARHRAYWPTVTKAMLAGSGQGSPNFEAIVALRPDAVFMPRNSDWTKAAKLLAGFGIPVVVLTAWDVLEHERNVELLGRLFDRPRQAAALNAFHRHWHGLLRMRLYNADRKRVYFEEVADHKTVLEGSGWHDMIEAGGGLNVFGDVKILDQPSARGSVQSFDVDPEEIIARRPDVIVKLQPGQYEPHAREFSKAVLERVARRPGFAGLPAVRAGQVHHLSYYLAGGCSKITGAVQIAKWLHPERFADVNPDAVMGTWLREFQGVAPQTGYSLSLAELRQ